MVPEDLFYRKEQKWGRRKGREARVGGRGWGGHLKGTAATEGRRAGHVDRQIINQRE